MSDTEIKGKKPKVVSVMPFVIEADHPTNADVAIMGLGNLRLRSAIKPVKEILDWEDGERIRRPVAANIINGMPRVIPGMQLAVNPAKGEWKMVDPLRNDEELCAKIKKAIDTQTGIRTSNKLRGVPPREGKLGADEMKTLVRELLCFINSKEIKVLKGSTPTMDDIDELPGRYLLNSYNPGEWNQPRYEDEYAGWKQTLNRL